MIAGAWAKRMSNYSDDTLVRTAQGPY